MGTKVNCCWAMLGHLGFYRDILGFCCASSSGFNGKRPKFPYFDTAEETICNFLQKREAIVAELNGFADIEIAQPCLSCSKLRTYDLFESYKIRSINISCYPSICQAKCIYCGVHDSPHNTLEFARQSRYPQMIVEMILYLQKHNFIDENCYFIFAPAEISIMPHKDLLLDATAKYRSNFSTNAFTFEEKMADSLMKNGSIVNVSLDSGARETFKLVKGFDLFEKVIGNLKKYRENGNISLKYNILSGVNDSEKDIDGIIGILKLLNLKSLTLSFEYKMPLRTAFYSIVKFVQKLKENSLSFRFHACYTPIEIEGFIEQFFTNESRVEYERKYNHLQEIFQREYLNNYGSYKKYVYLREIKDLILHFKEGTRFALLGPVVKDKYIIETFQKQGIPLHTPDAPYKESFDAIKDIADIYIMCNKDKLNSIKSYMKSKGCDAKRLLDVEKYYFSLEPTKLYLERNIDNTYLRR